MVSHRNLVGNFVAWDFVSTSCVHEFIRDYYLEYRFSDGNQTSQTPAAYHPLKIHRQTRWPKDKYETRTQIKLVLPPVQAGQALVKPS